jgi:hypothetical protein
MSMLAGLIPLRRRALGRAGLGLVLLLGGLALGVSLTTGLFPLTVGLALAGLLASLALFHAGPALVGTLIFALFLGVARRLFQYGFDTGDVLVDPLFLIPPLATTVLAAVAVSRGALRARTALSSAVLGITALGVVGALNPLQGGFLAAVLGLVVFITPVLWFWIGRTLVDDRRMGQVLLLAATVAVASAVYGLDQTSGHFFSWDQRWLDSVEDYASLREAGFTRAFGFASSAAEYGKLLGVGVVVVVSSMIARRQVLWLPVVGLLGTALFLSGLRTTLVLTVVALGLIWGTRRGASAVQLVLYGGIAVVVVFLLAAQFSPTAGGDTAATVFADRQLVGLGNPLDSQTSTLQAHVGLVGRSFAGLVSAPLGHGTATITIAGQRFGESQVGDTDLADAAIGFGVLGVAVYLILAVRLFRQAHLLAVRRGDALGFAAIGIVVVSSLQWLNGGLYAANFLAWLTFGWIDHAASQLNEHAPDMSEESEEVANVPGVIV